MRTQIKLSEAVGKFFEGFAVYPEGGQAILTFEGETFAVLAFDFEEIEEQEFDFTEFRREIFMKAKMGTAAEFSHFREEQRKRKRAEEAAKKEKREFQEYQRLKFKFEGI